MDQKISGVFFLVPPHGRASTCLWQEFSGSTASCAMLDCLSPSSSSTTCPVWLQIYRCLCLASRVWWLGAPSTVFHFGFGSPSPPSGPSPRLHPPLSKMKTKEQSRDNTILDTGVVAMGRSTEEGGKSRGIKGDSRSNRLIERCVPKDTWTEQPPMC